MKALYRASLKRNKCHAVKDGRRLYSERNSRRALPRPTVLTSEEGGVADLSL